MNEGLPNNEKFSNYRQKFYIGFDGLIVYACKTAGSAVYNSIYVAYPMGAWTKLLDTTMVDQGYQGTPTINAFGFDKYSGTIIAVGGAFDPGLPGREGSKYVYIGSAGGLTQLGEKIDIGGSSPGDLSFGLGEWLLTVPMADTFSRSSWAKLSAAGAVTSALKNFPTNDANIPLFHIRAGGKAFGFSNNGLRVISGNNGDSEAIYSAYDLGSESSVFDAAPSGQFLMGGTNAALGKRSSDGGATWGNIGTGGTGGMTSGYGVWCNCGDDMQWMAATTQKVLFSNDWGDTWTDKTGNLATLAPLCVSYFMRAWY